MKPRTGDGPLEVTKEGRGIVMRVPLEGGGRLVVELSADEAAKLGDALQAAVGYVARLDPWWNHADVRNIYLYFFMAASRPPAIGSSSGTTRSSILIMSASSRAPSLAGPASRGRASLKTAMPPARSSRMLAVRYSG